MQRLIAGILLLIIVGFTFNQTGIYFNYIIDIKGYTETYCINKDRPEMHCNGKCHLRKELAQNTENKQKTPAQLLLNDLGFFLPPETPLTLINSVLPERKGKIYSSDSFLSSTFIEPIFHPPIG